MKDGTNEKLQGLIFPVFLIVFWQLAGTLGWLNAYLFPAPLSILNSLLAYMLSGELFGHILISLYRMGSGIMFTFVLAVPTGLGLGLSEKFRKVVMPSLTFLQQIPPIAWIPVFILWLGIGESSKIALMVYASFFPVFINTLFGIQSVDPKLKEVAEAFRLTESAKLYRLYLPAAAPSIFVGLRLGVSNCWRALVAVEIIASSRGLGYILMEGRNLAQPELLFQAIFIIGLMGTFLDYFIRCVEKRVLPWSKG